MLWVVFGICCEALIVVGGKTGTDTGLLETLDMEGR